jgi:putative PIN family toxin of toxin-antitoxin system
MNIPRECSFQRLLMTALVLSLNRVRIVVDTNVFIAALLRSGGDNRNAIRACLKALATPLFGAALLHEYEDVMNRPELMRQSPLPPADRQSLFDALLSISEWTKVYYLWRPNLPDEADNHLIELALAGGAEAVVTNNIRDLRRGELLFPTIRVLTPKQFLEAISWQL